MTRYIGLALLVACSDGRATDDAGADILPDTRDATAERETSTPAAVTITVTLDGAPAEGARVTQGGAATHAFTDSAGRVTLAVDANIPGEVEFMASSPRARIKGATWTAGVTSLEISLSTYDSVDNEAYAFQDPGDPARHDNTGQCGHCHVTLNHDWYASPHRTSASNPALHHLYDGSAAFADATTCAQNGGRWIANPLGGKTPGRCEKGASVLVQNAASQTPFGACADCHAPGISGRLGGRDLRDADGHALDYGVHCDVCHRVESIDLAASAGVAGRLVMHRPSERSSSLGLGVWQPLTFGPHHDVSNPRMGLVQRDHFTRPTLCAGCHQYEQPTTNPRWPDGVLPIHTTYDEWRAGPSNPDTACQGCHMPPATEVMNSADLQMFGGASASGVAAGWPRPPGTVKHHSFIGPRQRASELLESAASLTLDVTRSDDTLIVHVTVTNVFAGHAIPTGEPMRSLVMLVEAACAAPLVAIGGDVVPDFGGAFETRTGTDDWSRWPAASVGDVIRVVRRSGDYRDYEGPGAFATRFSTIDKGMPVEQLVSISRVIANDAGALTLDRPLPPEAPDLIAYRGDGGALPRDGEPATARAGAPGYAFGKVLVAADGARSVPHFLAVDVASDNRLLPGKSWRSEHFFAATCASPTVSAVLVHRAYPLALAAERGWRVVESVMKSTTR